MTAKEYLEQYRDADREINKKLDRICRLREIATKTTTDLGDDRVQSSAENKTEKIVAEIVDLDAEVNKLIDFRLELKYSILQKFEQLPNERQRRILRHYYLRGCSFRKIGRICNLHHYEVSRIFNIAVLYLNSIYFT